MVGCNLEYQPAEKEQEIAAILTSLSFA